MHIEPFRLAEQAFQRGAYEIAKQHCRVVLDHVPDHFGAWHLQGKIHHHHNELDEAIECWQRALQIQPNSPLVVEFARLLCERRRFDEAIQFLQRSTDQQPKEYEHQTQLGITFASAGRLKEAVQVFALITKQFPDSPAAHHNLGVAQLQLGQHAEGIATLRRALQLRPDYPEACYSMGNALAALKQRKEAVEQFHQALRLRPNYPEALNNLGLQLSEMGNSEEAVAYLRQALRLRATFVEAQTNLGIALENLGRFDEAEQLLQQVLAATPLAAEAHTNMANLDKARGRLIEALAGYQYAMHLQPNLPSMRYNRALALLQCGDWEEGWAEYEWRWQRSVGPARCSSTRPTWDGSPGEGRSIVVWAEQGLGDTIQFVRYVSLLRERGFRVYLQLPGILCRLAQALYGIDGIIAEGEDLPPHDVQCPIMSLPHRCKTTLTNVPVNVPYLHADPALVRQWAATLGPAQGRRIGLYWQGNPHHRGDRHRSLLLQQFESLLTVPQRCFVSLQQGPGREQLASQRFPILELGPEYQTNDDLAAVIANLNLVITVDTACAHLAGAMGVPTWLLISANPDWRWLLRRTDTVWYPTITLFRQQQLGKWDDVIIRMKQQLLSDDVSSSGR